MSTHKYRWQPIAPLQHQEWLQEEQELPGSGVVTVLGAILLSFALLIVGLFSLTVVQGGSFSQQSKDNTLRKEVVYPFRGIIYDASMRPLVENKPTYDLYVRVGVLKDEDKQKLAQVLKFDYIQLEHDYNELQKQFPSGLSFVPVLFKHKIDYDIVLQMQVAPIPGVEVRESLYRHYPYRAHTSSVLGYTGKVYAEDLEANPLLGVSDIIGKTGIEKEYDQILLGQKGYELVEVNSMGEVISRFAADQQPALNGHGIVLSIDANWQKKMHQKLEEYVKQYRAKGGAGVIIELNTGAVKVLATAPTYDANQFVGGISANDYSRLAKNVQVPLLNRAIGAQLPAGSTFKTIVAAAALDKGAITPSTTFTSTGVIKLAGGTPFQEYAKHVYGVLTVRDALMVSSNIFFCRTIIKLGIDDFDIYASKFGIGSLTGIDLPGETPGRLPSPKNKIQLAKNGAKWLEPIWYPEGDSCNSAIGQGITLVTPLQLANVAAAIGNKGTVYKPYLVAKELDPDGKTIRTTQPVIREKGFVADRHLQVVREGMRMSVNGSRAIISILNMPQLGIAAKTGTAEFGIKDKDGYLSSHAWVMGFYPYNKPKYAFAVVLEGGGKSSGAAQVMRSWIDSVGPSEVVK